MTTPGKMTLAAARREWRGRAGAGAGEGAEAHARRLVEALAVAPAAPPEGAPPPGLTAAGLAEEVVPWLFAEVLPAVPARAHAWHYEWLVRQAERTARAAGEVQETRHALRVAVMAACGFVAGGAGGAIVPAYAGHAVRHAAQRLAAQLQKIVDVHDAVGLHLTLGEYERARDRALAGGADRPSPGRPTAAHVALAALELWDDRPAILAAAVDLEPHLAEPRDKILLLELAARTAKEEFLHLTEGAPEPPTEAAAMKQLFYKFREELRRRRVVTLLGKAELGHIADAVGELTDVKHMVCVFLKMAAEGRVILPPAELQALTDRLCTCFGRDPTKLRRALAVDLLQSDHCLDTVDGVEGPSVLTELLAFREACGWEMVMQEVVCLLLEPEGCDRRCTFFLNFAFQPGSAATYHMRARALACAIRSTKVEVLEKLTSKPVTWFTRQITECQVQYAATATGTAVRRFHAAAVTGVANNLLAGDADLAGVEGYVKAITGQAAGAAGTGRRTRSAAKAKAGVPLITDFLETLIEGHQYDAVLRLVDAVWFTSGPALAEADHRRLKDCFGRAAVQFWAEVEEIGEEAWQQFSEKDFCTEWFAARVARSPPIEVTHADEIVDSFARLGMAKAGAAIGARLKGLDGGEAAAEEDEPACERAEEDPRNPAEAGQDGNPDEAAAQARRRRSSMHASRRSSVCLSPVKEERESLSESDQACSMEVSEDSAVGQAGGAADTADNATSRAPPEAEAEAETDDGDFGFLLNPNLGKVGAGAKKGGRRRRLGQNTALQTSPDEKENAPHGTWRGNQTERPALTRRASGIGELHSILQK